ncbi:hypothetical protein HK096_005189 [Nowakowskiella sp. JEL0078]|nr:hypothetical protein HK096_005189 [Nowakowskiella sp. JEL0078]
MCILCSPPAINIVAVDNSFFRNYQCIPRESKSLKVFSDPFNSRKPGSPINLPSWSHNRKFSVTTDVSEVSLESDEDFLSSFKDDTLSSLGAYGSDQEESLFEEFFLPFEIWTNIAQYLPIPSLALFRQTSRTFSSLPLTLSTSFHPGQPESVQSLFYNLSLKAGYYDIAFQFAMNRLMVNEMKQICLSDIPSGLLLNPFINLQKASTKRVPLRMVLNAVDPKKIIQSKLEGFENVALVYSVLSFSKKEEILGFIDSDEDKIALLRDFKDHKHADLGSFDHLPLRIAALSGDFAVVKFLVDNGADISCLDCRPLVWAAVHGHVDILDFLYGRLNEAHVNKLQTDGLDQQNSHETQLMFKLEGEFETDDLTKSLADNVWSQNSRTKSFTHAAQNGWIEVVQWFIRHKVLFNPLNTSADWRKDQLEYEKNLSSSLLKAALNGHSNVVSWLLHNPTLYIPTTSLSHHKNIEMIIERGHLDVLKVIAEKIIFDARAAVYPATIKGHLCILKWLRDEFGVKFSGSRGVGGKAITAAVKGGCFEILEWLESESATLDIVDVPDLLECAVRTGKCEIVKWLFSQVKSFFIQPPEFYETTGSPFSISRRFEDIIDEDVIAELMLQAGHLKNFEIVKYLFAEGAKLDDMKMLGSSTPESGSISSSIPRKMSVGSHHSHNSYHIQSVPIRTAARKLRSIGVELV